MPITGHGWELLVERLEEQQKPDSGRVRTFGRYALFIEGRRSRLHGFMCECPGPGNNDRPGSARRIREGRYPLSTQFGRYVSTGFSRAKIAGAEPMPAFALLATEPRDGILVHPAYPFAGRPDNLYLSSIGCLNPAGVLAPGADNDFFDSRRRVVALIDSLRRFAPSAFATDRRGTNTAIPDAAIVIVGEPSALLHTSERAEPA